jgi:hypothetical protein
MGASPLAGKFPRAVSPSSLWKLPIAFNPPPFRKFREIKRRNKNFIGKIQSAVLLI